MDSTILAGFRPVVRKTFCGFSMGRNQSWARRVYDLCVYYMTGTPEGSTESGFMEKLGIEPVTPGLQGIALIHYTTGRGPVVRMGTYFFFICWGYKYVSSLPYLVYM